MYIGTEEIKRNNSYCVNLQEMGESTLAPSDTSCFRIYVMQTIRTIFKLVFGKAYEYVFCI